MLGYEKLKRFKEITRSESISKILLRVDPKLKDLFGRFSDWLHTISYLKRVTEYVFKSHEPPPGSLGSFMPYKQVDLDKLSHLEKRHKCCARMYSINPREMV